MDYVPPPPNRLAPQAIPELAGAVEIAAGHGSLCARGSEGWVRCWGSLVGPGRPREVPELRGSSSLALAGSTLCAIVGERVLCRIGIGEHAELVDAGITGAYALAGGDFSLCALRRDAPVICLRTQSGDLDEEDTAALVRFAVEGTEHATRVSSEGSTIVVLEGAEIRSGELPYPPRELFRHGESVDAPAPATLRDRSHIEGAIDVRMDLYTRCAIDAAHVLSCAPIEGARYDTVPNALPARLEHVEEVALATETACALHEEGSVSCWGSNWNGRAGVVPSPSAPPTRAHGLSGVTAISVASIHACALDAEGRVLCFGDTPGHEEPAPLDGMPVATQLVHAGPGVCALDREGSVHCACDPRTRRTSRPHPLEHVGPLALPPSSALAGDELLHAIGRDRVVRSIAPCTASAPAVEHASLRGATSIAAALGRVCGVVSGRVRCEPHPDTDVRGPRVLFDPSRLRSVTRLVGGFEQMCAVVRDREVECWGHDGVGQLALPPSPPILRPVAVSAIPADATGFAFGDHASCWIASGEVVCAGIGEDLRPRAHGDHVDRGDGSTRVIPGLREVSGIALHPFGGCAVARGEVWCWGGGVRGDGTWWSSATPRRVAL